MQHMNVGRTPSAATSTQSSVDQHRQPGTQRAADDRGFSSQLSQANAGHQSSVKNAQGEQDRRMASSGNSEKNGKATKTDEASVAGVQQKLGELELKLEEGDTVSDESWLDLISEIKSLAEGGVSEGQLDDLKAQLQQALDSVDGDLAGLLEKLQLDSSMVSEDVLDIDQLMGELEQLDSAALAGLQEKLSQLIDGGKEAVTQAELVAQLEQLEKEGDGEVADLLGQLRELLADENLDLQDPETQNRLAGMLQQLSDSEQVSLSSIDNSKLAAFMQDLNEHIEQQLMPQNRREGLAGESGTLGGRNLPPAAMAMSEAAQQLRNQLQALVQAQNESADGESTDSQFESLRRMVSEMTPASTANDGRGQQGNANTASNFNQALNQAGANRDAQAAQNSERSNLSAFEAARQTQQAVDILGTGAANTLRERISVMFNTRTQAAEMRLDPPDLGRLSIRLNMNQEQASVSFQVTTPQAREALEQSLPRLRELLQEQGIQLADANVSEQQSDGQQQAGAFSDNQGFGNGAGGEFAEDADDIAIAQVDVLEQTSNSDGRVDYFV
ncbi:flagellar hook-length control protein FliK [Aliidiomarina soli]|uniref:Flagellar hook-length control protein-like C-terminal domain-containing protein n=1 Tax=Aliidiomarina soli TaxID=1928574 RepID=A0A432WEJ7_9GAMM|nr:flagellar hook-length control protein FliK [Aliidiomarina soli]RUO31285.1 hypothetical protein CWE14_12420 [Aliidiomarina soli]